MVSRLLLLKKTSELEEFLFENRNIYPLQLSKFLKCSYRQAIRIFKYLRKRYEVKSISLPAEILRKYVEEI